MGVQSTTICSATRHSSPDQRLTMNIFGKNQELCFRGDFDPTQATNVNMAKLQQLVPIDRVAARAAILSAPTSTTRCRSRLPTERSSDQHHRYPELELSELLCSGLARWNQDVSVFKYFYVYGESKLRFTADFFNVFNHPNDLNSQHDHRPHRSEPQANEPRIIQFSARVEL